jgi:TonB family protein
MGYQALLFCPDEKTARTVTQVLSELEFNVETCTEPFAAVKKLMSQHFDAVVVDCDNEQNATLLFKSARNSTSNQASLAVAVVEGQAGVAKAFRIGANLVLTKPINIEQAKGTLRVARGLLRKSEPPKPGVAATASSAGIPVVNAPAKEKPPAATSAASAAAAHIKSDTSPRAAPPSAAAISSTGARDEDLLDMGEDAVAAPSEDLPVAPTFKGFITPAPQAEKFLAAAVVSAAPEGKSAPVPVSLAHGRGAASAPAPARERVDARLEEPAQRSAEADAPSKKAEAGQSQLSSLAGSVPTFSFGGNNATAESSGSGKKILVAAAAALIVAAVAYAGWAHFHERSSAPDTTPTEETPTTVVTPQATKPSGAKPSAASTAKPTSSSSLSLPNSQPALNEKSHGSDADSALDASDLSSAATNKAADADEAPLVIKGGKAPALHAKSGAADAPAPSMIGIATAGAGAPPPNFGSGGEIVPKPLLQTLNISQGVSHGLLIKKVQPVYPRNALAMRVEGSIELLATISKTGDITQVKVLSGDSQLTKAATDAVKQWKYKPYLLNGEPVEIQTQVTVNFKLPK